MSILKMNREDFSIFANYKDEHGKDLVYLDTAASSLTPDIVVNTMNEYYFKYRSNIDRGLYKSAATATGKYNEAREVVAEFFNSEVDEVIFTSGSTDGSNKLVRMLEQLVTPNKNKILVSKFAHHSDLVPLQELAKRNNLTISAHTFEEMEQLIDGDTFIVSCPIASNVTGEIFDVAKLAEKAKAFGAYIISDATAASGHIDINFKHINLDAVYMSAHKMCGPTGVGALIIKRNLLRNLRPVTFGGGMVWEVNEAESSYRSDVRAHEAGTAGIAEVIGFAAAIKYIQDNNILSQNSHIADLVEYAISKLSELSDVQVHSNINNNVGIVSFSVSGIHPHDIAEILGRHEIAMRAGHHCAQLAMQHLKVNALSRVSFYFYNTKQDIDSFIEALKVAIKTLK